MQNRDYSRDPVPYSPNHKKYPLFGVSLFGNRPPRMKRADRFVLLALLAFFLAYFAAGIWIDDLPLPGRYSGRVVHFHGISIWFLLGAFLCYVAYRRWFFPKDDMAELRPFRVEDLLSSPGGKTGLVLVCAGWLLFLAALISMIFDA
jgi:hypothetical protein